MATTLTTANTAITSTGAASASGGIEHEKQSATTSTSADTASTNPGAGSTSGGIEHKVRVKQVKRKGKKGECVTT
jgi:hypothetical protein